MSLKDKEDGFFTPGGIVQVMGLVLSVLLVGIIYSVIIRPQAEEYQAAVDYGVEERVGGMGDIFIILKDYEQQACFTLMVWVLMILAYKFVMVQMENSVLAREERLHNSGKSANSLLKLPPGGKIYPEDVGALQEHVSAQIKADHSLASKLMPHLILKGLERFQFSQSAQEASDVIKGRIDLAAERLESELSIIRYVAWAIPSVGFIGTVRGIGAALAKADMALEGDISGVTSSLGLAFNSTLVALFISIFLMFFIHTLQSKQEGVVLSLETFLRENLIDRLRTHEPEFTEEYTTAPAEPELPEETPLPDGEEEAQSS